MKKAIKWIIGIILGLVGLVLIAILTLPLWLGPVVKPLANAAVPELTKTSFHLGLLSLNPYTGRFEIGEMTLGNPEGYSEKRALELKKLAVDVSMEKTTEEVICLEEVSVEGLFVSYMSANGVNNFDQIKYNAAGGKEKYEANQAKAKAEQEAKAKDAAKKAAEVAKKDEAAKKDETEAKAEEKKAPRIEIDKLVIKDITLKYEMLVLPVPSITLTDLGKKSKGMTMEELIDEIMQAIIKAATQVGDGAKLIGGLVGDGAKGVGAGAGAALKAVGAEKAGEIVGSGVNKTVDAVGSGAGKTMDAVGSGAGKAVNAVGEGAKKVGEGAGKAVDAVGEGAKKAADALKNLF